MEESDISKCKACGKLEVRKHAGSFDGRNKKFVDAEGALWNGRKCPKCHRDKVKVKTKEKRSGANSGTSIQD